MEPDTDTQRSNPAELDPIGDSAEHMPSRDLATLLKVSIALGSSLDLGTVLQTAIESAVEVLELETGAIYTIDDDKLFMGATTPPLPPDFPRNLRIARLSDHLYVARAFTSGKPVFIPDARQAQFTPAEQLAVDQRGLRSILYLPLILEDKPVGTLIVGSQSAVKLLTPHQIDLSRTLGAEIALAIVNASLYMQLADANQELARAYDETILGWAHALDMRDHATAGHAERVTDLTIRLAERLGMGNGDIADIRRGAFLHDIGKMTVPDAILNKPGPLTPDEWEIMRGHPMRAHALLSRIDYLKGAIDIPFCHHERWDGSGYPRGLHGEDIPLAARAFAVVDVWDALTSDRPYRAAWPAGKAMDYLLEQAGMQFDPIVVAAFIQVLRQGQDGALPL